MFKFKEENDPQLASSSSSDDDDNDVELGWEEAKFINIDEENYEYMKQSINFEEVNVEARLKANSEKNLRDPLQTNRLAKSDDAVFERNNTMLA